MRRSRLAFRGLLVAGLLGSFVVVRAGGALATQPASQKKLAKTTLEGAGSTFQLPYTQSVISAFKARHRTVTVRYVAIGSTKGLEAFSNGLVDFAGVDTPVPPDAAAALKGGAHLYFPLVVAPISVVFNIPDVDALRLSADTLARIFEGDITVWDAPAIRAENPTVSLPNLPVSVVHRSDGSGTTENFTKFLTGAAPVTWTLGTGPTVQWLPGTEGAAGNYGVAQIVKTTPGTIGYVDYADGRALGLTAAAVQNKSGAYIVPSLGSAAAALVGTVINPDLTFDPVDGYQPDAYPITTPTWIVVYEQQRSAKKAAALEAWLRFVYSNGQQLAESANFVALPDNLVKLARAQIRQIVAPS
jgi:phosphate transport system substrate-binding protein